MTSRNIAIFVPDEGALTKAIRQLEIQNDGNIPIYSPFMDNLDGIRKVKNRRNMFYVDSLDSNLPLPDWFNVFDYFEFIYTLDHLPPQFNNGYRATLVNNSKHLEMGFVGMLVTRTMDNLMEVVNCRIIYPEIY